MKWEKLGRIFNPLDFKGKFWMNDYAQCTSVIVFDDFIRVFFSSRPPKDDNGQFVSYTSFTDFDKKDLTKNIRLSDKPILELGDLGTFDEFGIYPSSILEYNDSYYFYYAGWTRRQSIFADVSIGLAISKNGEDFKRLGRGPILTNTVDEPFQVSGPKVRLFNNRLFMFYIAGEKWILNDEGKSESIYKIRMATSDNGIDWIRNSINIIQPILENEECQAGPDVFFKDGKYHMYFSYRYGLNFRGNKRGYRIGYAFSYDLFNWHRDDDNTGIELSTSGWDNNDMHYPHIFSIEDNFYMLYNGNEFGRYGFGLAKLLES